MNKNDMNMKREQRFIKMVSRKLDKEGFECQMKEGHLVLSRDGQVFDVDMWNAPGWGKRRVHFFFRFAFEGMEKVEQEGLVWLMSESNNRSNYTTTQLWEDCFSCRVETIVCSAKDFVREFGFAYKQIGAAFKQMATIYPTVFDHFQKRSEHRPIGFLAARYMDEQEKDDRCKLVAQAFSSFAAENK